MDEENIELLPTYYGSWVRAALMRKDRESIRLLISELSEFKRLHEEAAVDQDHLVEFLEKTRPRGDGEPDIEVYRNARDHCAKLAKISNEVLLTLQAISRDE